jgi:hypothetical protein
MESNFDYEGTPEPTDPELTTVQTNIHLEITSTQTRTRPLRRSSSSTACKSPLFPLVRSAKRIGNRHDQVIIGMEIKGHLNVSIAES